jgi:hypothetical protein
MPNVGFRFPGRFGVDISVSRGFPPDPGFGTTLVKVSATAIERGSRLELRDLAMFDFDRIKHSAFAAMAALLFSATMISAAIGPVRVADASPTAISA